MTSLAWDGKTLAADTMYDQGGMKGYCSKLEIINHPIIGKMMIALCGSTRSSTLFVSQLESNIIKQVDDCDPKMIYGIGIDSAKQAYNIYGDGYCVMEHPRNVFMTGGSAWEFLMGALRAGCSAERAIGLAMEHRTDAGNECQKLVWAEVFKDHENERFNNDIPY